ncbi:hypothetical protein [Mycolicibacterium llatzerense]|uniref:hypothetical protein n=1 Tax=Mycolicibacterium llatzerense TaxID=280871 RepID=UPI0008DE2861|nr:hypothetical protein [Mycolicibacterium llatzerense]
MAVTAEEFEVEEVFTEHGEVLVLSLGFASARDPLDVLHLACGRKTGGSQPPATEHLLYLERTDQDEACDGHEVLGLVGQAGHIELALTDEGARLLQFAATVRFRFNRHPELLPVALAQLKAMSEAGQDRIVVA